MDSKKNQKPKQPWYLSTWLIAILCALWPYVIPPIIGIILFIIKTIREKKSQQNIQDNNSVIEKLNHRIDELNNTNKKLNNELQAEKEKLNNLGYDEYEQVQVQMEQLKNNTYEQLTSVNKEIQDNNSIIENLNRRIETLSSEADRLTKENDKLFKSVMSYSKKLSRCKELYNSMEYAMDNFFTLDLNYESCRLNRADFDEAELYAPTIMLKLHCMDIKSLRKAYNENEKLINSLLTQYSARYTTKANKTIYSLLVIALRSEMQNVLFDLKYEKLDSAIEHIKDISAKYLKIAGDGNQSIAVTLTKFIGELEYLFINSAKIEYNYYVKKEQARQEQLALKEQMRQEAEERKALEQEKKRILREEEKFNTEISKLQESIAATTDDDELSALKARILELQSQLSDVIVKKDEITNLQNGKAGTVYIISNLGSFGDDVFKVGMTRRLEPQDRINELGNASVPFKFDVHSFIFSQDAVALESKMHEILNDKRVNKVNMRKEFFKISIDELEQIVEQIEPTAEFNKTMVATEFRQSISSNENYTNSYIFDDENDEDE